MRLAGGSELIRRFQFGLASGLRKGEVMKLTGAVLSLLDNGVDLSQEALDAWIEGAWEQTVDQRLREKVAEWNSVT